MLALPAPNPLIDRVGNSAINCFYTKGDYFSNKGRAWPVPALKLC